MVDLDSYEEDWESFKSHVEKLAKDRCTITNKNWLKIREIHLSKFLHSHPHPFGFLIKVKILYPNKFYQINCMKKYMHVYKELRHRKLSGIIK